MLTEIVYLSRDGGNLPFCELVAPMYANLRRAAFIHLACDSLMASSRGMARSWAFDGEGERKWRCCHWRTAPVATASSRPS